MRGVGKGGGYSVRHGGEGVLECGAVGRGEAVSASVGEVRRPAQVHPGDAVRGRRSRRLTTGGTLELRHQRLPLLQDAVGQPHRPRRDRHQVDPRPDLPGELLEPPGVGRRPHVDQGDDDVPLPRIPRMKIAHGVQHRVPRRELVVDQHQRPVPGQQGRVLRQQQVGGGVRVGLLETAGGGDTGDRPAGGVQVGRGAQAVGDGVAEAGRGLGVPEHDGPGGLRVAQQFPDAAAESDAVPVHHGRRLGHVLAEDVRHEQVGALGVAPQRQPQHPAQPFAAGQLDAEPLGDPGAGPGVHSSLLSLTRPGRPRAVRRNRRPRWRRRRPRRAAGSAPPRRGAASPRSSCSCTRTAVHPRRRVPAAGCPGRR